MAKIIWDDEKLISLIEECPELYNPSNMQYNNVEHKDRVWNEIAMELEQPVKKCRDRWKTLRDSYRRSYKKELVNQLNIEKGIPVKNSKMWKYQKRLSFLLPFIKEIHNNDDESQDPLDERSSEFITVIKEEVGTVEDIDDIELSADNHTTPFIDVNTHQVHPTQPQYVTAEVVNHQPQFVDTEINHNQHPPLESTTNGPPEPKKAKKSTPDSSITLVLKHLEKKEQQRQERERLRNPLRDFFICMSDTVINFPPHLQTQIKMKVFDAVMEAEMQLNGQTNVQNNTINVKTEDVTLQD